MVINFYASFCPFSKKFAPTFEDAGVKSKEKYPDVTFAKLQCDLDPETQQICRTEDVEVFPDTQLWQNGEMKDFLHGLTDVDGILTYVKKHTEPLSTKLECDKIEDHKKDSLFSLIFFGKETDALYAQVFLDLAKFELDETQFNFYHNDDYACAQKYNVEQPGVMMFRHGFSQNNVLVYKGAHKLQEFSTWAKTHLVPPIFEIEDKHDSLVMGQDTPVVVMFRDKKDENATFMKEFEKAAIKNEGKIAFAYSGIYNRL